MSLDGIIGGFAQYQRLQSSSSDDDFVDHLNHIYTVIILVIFAIFVSGKQYVGNPIECFSEDMEFGYAKREYARTYCWLKNTYKVGTHTPLPRSEDDRKEAEIPYYQWVPIFLLVLAVIFKLPNLLWRITSSGCGLDLSQLSHLVRTSQMASPDDFEKITHQVADHLYRWLTSIRPGPYDRPRPSPCQRLASAKCWCVFYWGRRSGTYLTGQYLLTKFLFLANSVAVLVLLWKVLGTWYVDFGLRLLQGSYGSSMKDDDGFAWPDLPYFPKLTFCDFTIRHQSNINTHTVQCALPINMFNEKIFGFLWFWIIFVTTANSISFLLWVFKLRYGSLHGSHIRDILEDHGDLITDYDRHLALNFGNKFLGKDGCFVVQVIRKNSNILVTGDVVSHLFAIYRSKITVEEEKGGGGDIMYL